MLNYLVCLWVISQYNHSFYPISSNQPSNNIFILQLFVYNQLSKATMTMNNIFLKKSATVQEKKVRKSFTSS